MSRLVVLLPLFIMLSQKHCAIADAPQNSNSPFGVICSWNGIEDAGIKWVRCGAGCSALDWGAINKAPGVFEWSNADSEIRDICDRLKADILVILGYTPEWASSGPNKEPSYPPRNLSDWSNFVGRIVSRYKNRIKYWEVWNEPDIGFWQGTVEQYADLVKSAYVAAKRADPDCKIVLGGTAGVNLPFIEQIYEQGVGQYFDILAVHPYQWGDIFDDRWFNSQLRDLRQLMQKWGDGHKEIWLTELGWSTGDKSITEEVQARLLAQAMITAYTLTDVNVTKYFWFCVKDWGGPGYGLIRPDGSRKPAFNAYRTVISALKDAEYLYSIPNDNLRCHMFCKQGREMLAVWSPDRETHEFKLPSAHQWEKLMHIGGKLEYLDLTRTSIKISSEPVFIFGKNKVEARKRIYEEKALEDVRKDVWYSIQVPQGTSRLWIDKSEKRLPAIKIIVHNDSPKPVKVAFKVQIGRFTRIVRHKEPIRPGEAVLIPLVFLLPSTCKTGLETLEISGTADGKRIPTTRMNVRISNGPVIEFLANSTVERGYIIEDQGSGCAPSVRFGGTWTYKFNLENCRSASVDLCVGAHNANEWKVLISRDQRTWDIALSGKSNRSWHSVDLSPYVGGPIFLKFEGKDQQLSELVLAMNR
ncbi:MAG: glycosyl hydrolase [Armatimonadota bacterium]|nr:glycosyl hydrolase [Armatimonadota bacterium]